MKSVSICWIFLSEQIDHAHYTKLIQNSNFTRVLEQNGSVYTCVARKPDF